MDKKIYGSKVLELFFDDPEAVLHIREIARQTGIHPNTALRDVNLLAKEKLVLREATRAIVQVKANRDAALFYTLKRLHNLRQILLSGLVEFLHEEYAAPEAIVLFGSYSRGEDTKKSDVDIAIITKRNLRLKLGAYEALFKRPIQCIETDTATSSKEFMTNLANGIVLKGYLRL